MLVILAAISLAAHRWGYDSRDGINSLEWAHREHY